jgi:hypothetical protein
VGCWSEIQILEERVFLTERLLLLVV